MTKINLALLALAFSLTSCKEFIEPSLEHQKIKAIAPAEGTETSSYQLTFWWEGHVDALAYRLQVVAPSFAAAQQMILDTLVKTDRFTYTLDPGNYQWRVRAENGSSQTAYVTNSFKVYPSTLTEQSVQLVAPAHQLYTANATLSYQWLKLFGASAYRLQIDRNNFSNEQNLDVNVLTDNLSYSHTLLTEGNYQIRVRAENATENSKWSAVRTMTYDISPPAQVSLSSPANRQTLAKPFNLTWSAINDATQYELAVYQSDSVTLYHSSFPQLLNTTSYNFNMGSAGENLVWRVRAIDRAGNKGIWSNYFSFTIQ